MVLFFILILLIGCSYEEENTLSYREFSSSNMSKLPGRWPINSFPLRLRISEDFTDEEIAALQEQADSWEMAIDDELDFFDYDFPLIENLEPRNSNDYKDHPSQGSYLGIYKSSNWPKEFGEGTLAITQFFGLIAHDGHREYVLITHADIILNYQWFRFSNDPGLLEFDFRSVAIHELGHLLGLPHNSVDLSDSVMWPSLPRYTKRRELSYHDEQNIKRNYRLPTGPVIIRNLRQGQRVRGVIELKANGKCIHSIIWPKKPLVPKRQR